MKNLLLITIIVVVVFNQPTLYQHYNPPPSFQHHRRHLSIQDHIKNLDIQLQSLSPTFLEHFVRVYHPQSIQIVRPQTASAQNGAYFLYLGKMYLYGMFDNPNNKHLEHYQTQAHHLAAYFYLKTAAQKYGNQQAYYFIGLLQQFKLVPDKLIETNLAKKQRSKHQEVLYKYLKTSHLNNGEHMLYMSAALGFDPAALVLGHMNRQPFGTTQNCTTALAYYLAVLKRTLFEPYVPKLVFDVKDSLQDELFSRRKLQSQQERKDHHFVVETGYFDQETISATLEQANKYYTGSGGVLRDLPRSLLLFQKLSHEGNTDGKIMAGLMYFRGEGTPRDIHKAKRYFEQTSKDQVSQYMLLAMEYFEVGQTKTRDRAIQSMKSKILKKAKLSHLMEFIIGSAALKGEIKEVSHDDAVQMIDRSAAEGNPSARLLMAILFADGTKGLKYGCPEATKYLSEDALSHPYFRQRVNTAQAALKRGMYPFAFYKYFELVFNNYPAAFVNTLYLLQMYKSQALRITPKSWLPSELIQSPVYISLRKQNLVPQIYSYLLNQYSPVGTKPIKMIQLDQLLHARQEVVESITGYMMLKIVKRGVVHEKRGILKYYEYILLMQEGGDPQAAQTILSTIASGDSTKLYVSEARYLLGKLYHTKALRNKTELTEQQSLKVMGEYNRAVKSQLLGNFIFEIEQYRLTGQLMINFTQSDMGEDLLTYIFVLAIGLFTLYYLRSKRFDHFHRMQLERQLRKAQEEQQEQRDKQEQQNQKNGVEGSGQNQVPQSVQQMYGGGMEEQKRDPDQPVIIEEGLQERPVSGGVRIGSSLQEQSN